MCEYFKVWGWAARCESGVGLRVDKLTPIHILDPQPIRTTHPLIKNAHITLRINDELISDAAGIDGSHLVGFKNP